VNPGAKSQTRPQPQICIRMLTTLHENGETNKTRLANMSNISYRDLQKYLPYLLNKKMITVYTSESGHDIIRITSIGVDALNDLSKWY